MPTTAARLIIEIIVIVGMIGAELMAVGGIVMLVLTLCAVMS